MANQIVTGLKSGIRISGRFQPESEFQISPEVFKLTKCDSKQEVIPERYFSEYRL